MALAASIDFHTTPYLERPGERAGRETGESFREFCVPCSLRKETREMRMVDLGYRWGMELEVEDPGE